MHAIAIAIAAAASTENKLDKAGEWRLLEYNFSIDYNAERKSK